MSHPNIKYWNKLKAEVESLDKPTREDLLTLLIWYTELIKKSTDPQVNELYQSYFSYLEKINILEYREVSNLWYSLEEIIEYDILKPEITSYSRPIVKTRDLLWELIAFKTDKQCPICDRDCLRALSPNGKDVLFLSCDNCCYTEDLNGIKVTNEEPLYPAQYLAIENAGLKPSRYP
jgi:hypothetical protein